MSVIIYKMEDRINLKIDSLEIKIAPLSFAHKMEITSKARVESGAIVNDRHEAMFLSIKHSVKEIKGLEMLDGKAYKLMFDESGSLSDLCVEELLNTTISNKLILACLSLVNSVPDKIVNHITGEEIDGVSIVKKRKKKL